jgi:methyl coenzyme M reductase alpha subunit
VSGVQFGSLEESQCAATVLVDGKLQALVSVLGVICAISLVVGLVSYISGGRAFPSYSSPHSSRLRGPL